MKNIKLAKKEYIVMEKSEFDSLLTDMKLLAIACKHAAQDAEVFKDNPAIREAFLNEVTGLSDFMVEYIHQI